jgi:hypothetical protein
MPNGTDNPAVTLPADLVELIAQAVCAEARHYPGDETCEDRCTGDEYVCMEANVHLAWARNGVIGSVYASPRRLAEVALSALAASGRLLPNGATKREEVGTHFAWTYGGEFVDNGVEPCVDSSCRSPHDRRRTIWTGPWTEVQP